MRILFASLAIASALPLAAQTQTLTTVFGPATFLTAPVTLYFDLTVANPAGAVCSGLDLNSTTAANLTGNLAIYRTVPAVTTYVGNERLAANWSLLTTATISTRGTNAASPTVLASPFYLPAGTYGIAVHHVDFNPGYSNPTAVTPNLPLTYSDSNLSVTCGRARASLAADPFGGTSTGNSPRIINMNLRYVVGTLACEFTATPTSGSSPLAVQFTDASFSGAPGGIQSWAWDFDGDSIVDSTLQNPGNVYACGNYAVALTVTDANGSATVSKPDFVRTDVVTPAFATSLLNPTTLQFTDATSPLPDSWAWDLDGDNVVDSTAQNPSWNYGSAYAQATVTLTVTKACQTYTLTKKVVAAKTLETRFDGGTITVGTATGGASFVDLTVLHATGVAVGGMWVHSNLPAPNVVTVKLWAKAGAYAGSEAIAADWRLLGTAQAASGGLGQRTYVAFAQPVYFAPGSYGLCIELVGHSPVYINVGGTQTFANADLSLVAGATQAEPVLGTGTLFTPRIWNGALHYTTSDVVAEAGYGLLGAGCSGSLGIPGNTATALPRLGNTATLVFDRLPVDAVVLALGFSRTNSVLGALPFDLTVVGAPGCWSRCSLDYLQFGLGSAGSASFGLPIPNLPQLLQAQFYTQGLVLDASANGFGGVVSDAAAALVGQ